MQQDNHQKIYLDNNATTLIDKEILNTINSINLPLNPSSAHFLW